MTNSRAASGLETLLKYEAASTEATKTLTKTLTNDKYSEIIIIMDGEASATFALQLVVNSVEGTSNYSRGFSYTGSAVASVISDGASQLQIYSAIGGAYQFAAEIHLYLNDINIKDILGQSTCHEGQAIKTEQYGLAVQTTATSITSIEMKTSTSTWKAGTKISIYGVLR